MQFQPKSENDIPKFGPLPAGDYDGTVTEAHDERSQGGNDMIHLVIVFKTDDGTRSRTVHDYLLEAMAGKLRHFCASASLMSEYEAGTLSAADCQGQRVRAKLRIKKQEGYDDKNEVADYLERQQERQQSAPQGRQATGGNGKGLGASLATSPIVARESAWEDFRKKWAPYAASHSSQDSSDSRNKVWSDSLKCYFAGRDTSKLNAKEWIDFGAALRANWTPDEGFAKVEPVAPDGSPFSPEEQFKEDDIPF